MKKLIETITNLFGRKPLLATPVVIARLFPLFWIVYFLFKTGLVRGENGSYWCDPQALGVSRIIFKYIPRQEKTKKGTKFCGNWHWVRLIFWEVHFLIYEKHYNTKKERIPFP